MAATGEAAAARNWRPPLLWSRAAPAAGSGGGGPPRVRAARLCGLVTILRLCCGLLVAYAAVSTLHAYLGAELGVWLPLLWSPPSPDAQAAAAAADAAPTAYGAGESFLAALDRFVAQPARSDFSAVPAPGPSPAGPVREEDTFLQARRGALGFLYNRSETSAVGAPPPTSFELGPKNIRAVRSAAVAGAEQHPLPNRARPDHGHDARQATRAAQKVSGRPLRAASPRAFLTRLFPHGPPPKPGHPRTLPRRSLYIHDAIFCFDVEVCAKYEKRPGYKKVRARESSF